MKITVYFELIVYKLCITISYIAFVYYPNCSYIIYIYIRKWFVNELLHKSNLKSIFSDCTCIL